MDSENILENLEDNGKVVYNEETGLIKKANSSSHLQENEVCCVLLQYIAEDIKISSREIARQTGINERTINRVRRSDKFQKMLIEHTNKKMLLLRCDAIEEMEKMLHDKNLNPNTKVKLIQTILSHSEKMSELAIMAGMEATKIDINVLMAELENM